MGFDILMIIAVTSFIQSLFGVGVLLFGTPLLLLQGYDFVHALTVLLPVSLVINLLQVAKDYRRVDLAFYRRLLVWTMPLVVVSLLFVTTVKVNITLLIGVFLLVVAARDYSTRVDRTIKALVRHENVYCAVMGIIHGLTNLGGSLLTALVHSKGYEKEVARVTVAVSYATFALFQLLTLALSGHPIAFAASEVASIGLGVAVFVLTEAFVFTDLRSSAYSRYFGVFLFFSGVLLCFKSV